MPGLWTDNWRGVKNAVLLGAFYPGLSTVTDSMGSTVSHVPDMGYCDTVLSPLAGHTTGSAASYNLDTVAVHNGYGTYVLLGNGGNVDPSASDYTLGGVPLLRYLSVAAGDPSFDTVRGKCSRSYTVHVQNTGAAAVTLTEWGLFVSLSRENTGTGTSYRHFVGSYPVLVYHATLPAALTLQPGASATVELTLELTLDDPV